MGKESQEFRTRFVQENNGAQIKMIRWFNDPKLYGSMVIFVSKEDDAQLLKRKIAHMCGEAVLEVFQYQHRPIHCRNCQQYGHKAAHCPNHTVCEWCAE